MAVQQELMSIPDFGATEEESLFSKEKKLLRNLKKAGLMVSGAAVQKYMEKLSEEQEVLMNLADMLIEGYVAESVLLRVEKMVATRGEDACAMEIDMVKIYMNEATEKCVLAAKEAIYAISEGDTQRMMLMGLKRFTKMEPMNLKDARRRIADHMIKENKYPF
jgi:hypothetical protein